MLRFLHQKFFCSPFWIYLVLPPHSSTIPEILFFLSVFILFFDFKFSCSPMHLRFSCSPIWNLQFSSTKFSCSLIWNSYILQYESVLSSEISLFLSDPFPGQSGPVASFLSTMVPLVLWSLSIDSSGHVISFYRPLWFCDLFL